MNIDRRSFLKGGVLASVAGAGAALSGGAVAWAAPEVETTTTAETYIPAYRAPIDPIPEDEISETLEADIVIVGAGNAGTVAAATAAECGASVIVLQKCDDVFAHGTVFSALNTQRALDEGINQDGWEAVNYLIHGDGNNLAKPEVIRNWVDYSGEMGDWIINLVEDKEENGGPIIPEPSKRGLNEDYWNWHCDATLITTGEKSEGGSIHTLIKFLANHAQEVGDVAFLFSTPGKVLCQDETGRVTGVIGVKPDGSYVLCNARNGVILASGGYEQNDDMRNEFLPMANGLTSCYLRPNTNTGDGLIMGMWAGGVMQKSPHSSNIHYDPGINMGTPVPFLRVNKNGERFSNEDVPFEQTWAQDVRQPGCCHYQIFDANYKTDVQEHMDPCMSAGGNWDTLVESNMDSGEIFTGNTIAELAETIGVPADVFEATVARYNELCDYDGAYEPDFGKQMKRMTKIQEPPFYAIIRTPHVLTTLAGLEVNKDYQVLNENNEPIEGLYAAGNCSGNFFGGLYQLMGIAGMGVGRAFLSGRIAAKRACGIAD